MKEEIKQAKETREFLLKHNFFYVEYDSNFIEPEEALEKYRMALIDRAMIKEFLPILGPNYFIENKPVCENSGFYGLKIIEGVRIVEGSHAKELHKILNAFNV